MDTVTCPSCGEENPSKFKLCGFCGTSLAPAPETVICPSCGEENPSRFRLCGFCGTALAGVGGAAALPAPVAAPVGEPIAAPPAAPVAPVAAVLPAQEVRKLVTLVFTDLKDSTALTASIDAEAMNEIKARYFATMRAEIERFGGNVEKNIGDAIMAVFGRVRAREDDALRGVQAAAGMVAKLHSLNEEFEQYYGVRLTVRTGVNTGEVVASTDENATMNLATGDAVNVAARLEQNAPANEVLIGEITYALVRDYVDAERVELTLKGKAEPVPAYLLQAVREVAATPAHEDSPFVGREFEMDILGGAFAQATEHQGARIVTVIGDAGVGKTRLIADFLRRMEKRAIAVRGRCLAYGDGITFWPLTEIVREAAKIAEDDTPESARIKIGKLIDDTPDRDAIVARVCSAVGLTDGAFAVADLFWGARRLLESQASARPLIVVVDDIHWAEQTFLDFLVHLVTAVKDRSILIVCSARPEFIQEHEDWTDQTHVERIDLRPLDSADVEAMIDRLLGTAELSDDVRARVVEAAEGNPLYIEQMVSMVREHGGGEIVVPPTINALLAARLDNLTREERAVVEPASVIGLVFAEAAVEAMVPDPLTTSVPTHLSDLDRKQFVHPLPADDDPLFRFHHILVRDAAYQSLLKRARANLHERFVAWAEPVNKERGREAEFEEILGYHLEQAVRYRSELGPLDAGGKELAARAAKKLASAGRRAFARGDLPAAASLMRRSISMLDEDDPVHIRLSTELAEALYELGEFGDATAVVESAGEHATRIEDTGLAARARLVRLLLAIATEETGANQIGEEATVLLGVVQSAGDESDIALAWRVIGVTHATAGRYNAAAEAAQQVVAHAKKAGVERMASRAAAGYATIAMAGSITAAEVADACRDVLEQVAGDRKAEATILAIVAVAEAMVGQFDAARATHSRARGILNELGPSQTAASTSIEGSRVALLAGDLDAAERELRADDEALADMGEHYFRSTIVAILAHVLVLRGQLDDADRYATLAADLADADDTESQALWRAARARLAAVQGNVTDALTLAEEAVAIVDETENIDLQGGAYVDLGVILRQAGRDDDASEAFAAALDRYERKGNIAAADSVREMIRERAAI